MDGEEPLGRKNTREIVDYVTALCRKNGLMYTVLFSALLSQEETEDIADWISNISLGLFYEDYIRLLELIRAEPGQRYYVTDYRTDDTFTDLYARVLKPSRVALPPGREADQRYYDYYMNVYPIFYAGDTRRELRKVQKKAVYYQRCIHAVRPVPYGRFKLRGLYKRFRRIYYANQRKKNGRLLSECLDFLSHCGSKESKYVYLPVLHKQKGIVCLAETYRDVGTYRFGDSHWDCINRKRKWLDTYYTKKRRKRLLEAKANRAVLDGPEILRRVQLISLELLVEFDRICRKHQIRYILAAGTLLGAARHGGFIPWDDDTDVFILHEEWEKFQKAALEELDRERFYLRTQESDKDDNLVFYQMKRNGTVYCKGGREQFVTHKGISLDIIPFYNSPDLWPVYRFQNSICRFFKTMTWAHMGAESVRRFWKRQYYRLLAKVPNKKSYALYSRFARMVREPGPYLVYLCAARNPFKKGFNQRKYFENTVEMEFENHLFFVPKEYEEFLCHSYSEDYSQLPLPHKRVNHHLPAIIDVGDLYEYKESDDERSRRTGCV